MIIDHYADTYIHFHNLGTLMKSVCWQEIGRLVEARDSAVIFTFISVL